MLLINPLLLSVDIGFQLSFAAILGIIYIYPLGDRLTKNFLAQKKWRTKTKKIIKTGLETINLTLVAQIVILPIALVNFQQLSVIAPVANLLTLWTFPFLLGSLISGLFLAALIPILGPFFFLPAYLMLKFVFIVSGFLAEPSWAAATVSGFNWWWGGGYYLVLAVLIVFLRKLFKKIERLRHY
jgi:competence protein ComEC